MGAGKTPKVKGPSGLRRRPIPAIGEPPGGDCLAQYLLKLRLHFNNAYEMKKEVWNFQAVFVPITINT
jgi:hypothetical protein